jgi:hypothetical protein
MYLRANHSIDEHVLRCSTEASHATIIMPLEGSALILAEYMHHHNIT